MSGQDARSAARALEILDWISDNIGAPLDDPGSWLMLASAAAFLTAFVLWVTT